MLSGFNAVTWVWIGCSGLNSKPVDVNDIKMEEFM